MAPSLQLEESSWNNLTTTLFKSQQNSSTSSVLKTGLIIGQRTSEGSCLGVLLVPTPIEKTEKDEVAKDLSESTLFNNLPVAWICEHARQVKRMLTGGMSILGVSLFVSQELATSKATAPTLQKLLKKLAMALTSPDHLLVLNICSKTKKPSCREYDTADRQFEGRNVDLKVLSLTRRFLAVSCDFVFEDLVPIKPLQKGDQKSNATETLLASVSDRLQSLNDARLFDNESQSLPRKDSLLSDICPASATTKKLDLLLPGLQKGATSATGLGGTLRVSGIVHSVAFVYNKEKAERAKEFLVEDIKRSLLSRLELLCDDLEDQQSLEALGPALSQLPKRVFFPALGSLLLSDYTLPDEPFSELAERVSALLDLSPSQDSFTFPEEFPSAIPSNDNTELKVTPQHSPKVARTAQQERQPSGKSTPMQPLILVAVLVLLAGILLSLFTSISP